MTKPPALIITIIKTCVHLIKYGTLIIVIIRIYTDNTAIHTQHKNRVQLARNETLIMMIIKAPQEMSSIITTALLSAGSLSGDYSVVRSYGCAAAVILPSPLKH
jgi:hypothetical protein